MILETALSLSSPDNMLFSLSSTVIPWFFLMFVHTKKNPISAWHLPTDPKCELPWVMATSFPLRSSTTHPGLSGELINRALSLVFTLEPSQGSSGGDCQVLQSGSQMQSSDLFGLCGEENPPITSSHSHIIPSSFLSFSFCT